MLRMCQPAFERELPEKISCNVFLTAVVRAVDGVVSLMG